MNVRRVACEPCRHARLACGHERPTCSRCLSRGRENRCVYRARPFRRQNLRSDQDAEVMRSSSANHASVEDASPTPRAENTTANSREAQTDDATVPCRYPNPGFLGVSSHSTIFNQMASATASGNVLVQTSSHPSAQTFHTQGLVSVFADWSVSDKSAQTLHRLEQLDFPGLVSVVRAWLRTGVNLPLAEPFVVHCVDAVAEWSNMYFIPSMSISDSDRHACLRSLCENTNKPLSAEFGTTIQQFISQMTGTNIRWESIGIFLAASARAVYDTTCFPPLFSYDDQRRQLVKTLAAVGDCCLETCLTLDCLNDLQLILQYENLIVHSQIDGDQSYRCWRRLGDVASSLFALGYHEKAQEDCSIPEFMAELRKACFARIYAADKSLAIFLGRPPRIVKDYCTFQVPSSHHGLQGNNAARTTSATESGTAQPQGAYLTGRQPEEINYMADTRCSALFASFKEEILPLLRRQRHFELDHLRALQRRVEQQWEALPLHFRLSTRLKDCREAPFVRDFLAGTRLDYLHIHFLLNLVTQSGAFGPDSSLLRIAREMLSIVVEVIILRDRLVNSGTCLIWKVAQYGLPAAGVVSLALLNPTACEDAVISRAAMMQDLSALVTEINIGAWIQAGDPNYALFMRATGTIKSLLESLMAWKSSAMSLTRQNLNNNQVEDWGLYLNPQYWEFEMGFWASLAEHPILLN